MASALGGQFVPMLFYKDIIKQSLCHSEKDNPFEWNLLNHFQSEHRWKEKYFLFYPQPVVR